MIDSSSAPFRDIFFPSSAPFKDLSPSSSAPFTPLSATPCLTRVTSKTNITSYYVSEPGDTDPISDLLIDIRNFVAGFEDIETYIKENLGVCDLQFLSFRQTGILEELQAKIGLEAFKQIEKICTDGSSVAEVSKNLVGYIEYTQRKKDTKSAAIIAEWLVGASFLSILETPNQDVKQVFLDKIDELYSYQQDLVSFTARKIPDAWIGSLIKPILPSNIPGALIHREASDLRDSLQKFLEERIFNPKRDCVLQKQFFGIWMRINDDESLWLICYPIKREKYKTPPPAVELFIPFDAAEISAPKISEVVQTDEEHCKIEVENHKLVAELPLSELYISPAPLVHLGSPCLLKKESGFINLQKTLENDPLSLEPLDRVNICLSVISAVEVLEKGGFVAPCLDPSAIMFQKGGKAKLDSLFHLRALSSENRNQLHESLDTKRLDLLAREKKNVSLDTGRYGLILLICELFFLSIQEIPRIKNMFDWGEEFLGRFKSVASPELYKEVYSLREKCGSLNKCFSEGVLALYNLRKNKKNKEDKKDPEKEALGQLASLVLFPVLPGLLLETLSIEGIRREKLDQGCFLEEILLIEPMPSLKDIRKVLEEGKSELVSLLDGIN